MKVLALLALFSLFFMLLVRGDPCSVSTEQGDFDLSSLTGVDGKDYIGKDLPNPKKQTNVYYIQICAETIQPCNQGSPPTAVPSVVCQNDTNGSFHSCGVLSSQTIVAPNSTVQTALGANVYNSAVFSIVYTGGQPTSSGGPRASAIVMVCDNTTTAGGAVKGTVNEPAGGNTYYIPFYTSLVCPDAAGGGGGGVVFIIIFFSLFGVYFIGGALFMKFARGASGKEIIPNVEFWADLPSLIKEGVMFVVNKARGRQNYSSVP